MKISLDFFVSFFILFIILIYTINKQKENKKMIEIKTINCSKEYEEYINRNISENELSETVQEIIDLTAEMNIGYFTPIIEGDITVLVDGAKKIIISIE